jgi:predicted hotdog family 3-hydroxylacyl-ACP dehydratase
VITIKRKIWGVVPYTTAFFPTESAFDDVVARLRPFEMARLFYTPVYREPDRHIVAREPSTTVCVDLGKSVDDLSKALQRKCRQKIGHIEKMSSRVNIARNGPQTRRDFLALFNSFAHAKDHVSPIDARTLDLHAPHADVFVIYLDGRPMCAHSVLRDAESAHARLLFLGSRRLEDPGAATLCSDLNRFLHWHEIRLYRDENFRIFDFGGVRDDPHDGIARFKRSFGGVPISENSYLCAGSPWIGRIAENMRRRLRSHAPSALPLDPVREVRDEYSATS